MYSCSVYSCSVFGVWVGFRLVFTCFTVVCIGCLGKLFIRVVSGVYRVCSLVFFGCFAAGFCGR